MAKQKLPAVGDKIPVKKFHVSKYNVRHEHPFGETDEDKRLIAQLRRGNILQSFKARPEGNEYGVYMGRRRFLAKKFLGTKMFEVGKDCIIEEIDGDMAREASLVENLPLLQKDMDPITRAEALNKVLSFGGGGLRQTAARLGMSPSTLSQYLKVLELAPRMREAVRKGLIPYMGKTGTYSALGLAKLDLSTEKQEELAELLFKEGPKMLWAKIDEMQTGKRKRGLPKDVYVILRTTFDKRWKPDVETWKKLEKLAESKNMKVDEYTKWVLSEHVKNA